MHGTSRHTGGRRRDNAHTQVNMRVPLLLDPLVWNIKLPLHSGGKTFLNLLFVLLTSVLLIMLIALRMIFAVIGTKNQTWSEDSAAIWQAIVTFFKRNGPMMMEMIEEAWYYISQSLATLLWINLLALSLFYWRDNNKDTDAY
jgi:hypothetical protein